MEKFISRVIKDYRKKRGVSLQRMAEDLGTTRQSLSRYEHGHFEQIPVSTIFDIVDYLRIPLDYVFSAVVLDGMNKYRFEQLNEELKNRTYLINEDFFTSYNTEYVQKNLKEVDTPYINAADLFYAMDVGVFEDGNQDDLKNLIETLSIEEREKAYNILKQVFDE